jgi:acyl-CoA thioester hydrolase
MPSLPLEAYPSQTSAEIRYADMDRQGHVNNAVFATFSEIGRVAFLYDPERPLAPAGTSFVVARLAIDFLAELLWPGTVEIGTGVIQIGRSSFTVAQGLFSGRHCVAGAEAVIVLVNGQTRRSTPLPPETIAALERLRLGRDHAEPL